ncbi:hypothetical protein J3R82DRAFT_9701 [Butyriboletus roseoflavus]|nr:hypothetical protein J3R82DRAFT_9701 [Butyriboletus roseoflavus]
MNILPKGAHSMRIIALPLARVKVSPDAKRNPSPDLNASTMLVFYHFDLISPCSRREDLSWHKTVLKNADEQSFGSLE